MFSLRILQVRMDRLLHARIEYRKISGCNCSRICFIKWVNAFSIQLLPPAIDYVFWQRYNFEDLREN